LDKPKDLTYATPGYSEKQGQMSAEQQGSFNKSEKATDAHMGMMEGQDIQGRVRASDLIGKAVVGKDGNEVGDLRNILLDRNGDAKYALIAFGGFLGLGEKLVAAPWTMIEPAPTQDQLLVNASSDKLRNAPAFDEKTYGKEFENQVNAYYGSGATTKSAPEFGTNANRMESEGASGLKASGILKSSDLIGKGVMDQQGEQIGTIRDMILSEKGKVDYLFISSDVTAGDHFVAVPWSIIKVEPETNQVTLLVTKDKLANAPTISESEWQKVHDPEWSRQVDSYFGKTYGGEMQTPMHDSTMKPGEMSHSPEGTTGTY
jgi:sporulation protein YlmC with PRC-barrel domain